MAARMMVRAEAAKATKSSQGQTSGWRAPTWSCLGALLLGLAALLLVALAATSSAEARYLPTRADERDVEVLKGLIKGVSSSGGAAS